MSNVPSKVSDKGKVVTGLGGVLTTGAAIAYYAAWVAPPTAAVAAAGTVTLAAVGYCMKKRPQVIEWPNQDDDAVWQIEWRKNLSIKDYYNATTTGDGKLTYKAETEENLKAGPHVLKVTAAPTGSYLAAEAERTLTVIRAKQNIVWQTIAPIVYGQLTSAAQQKAKNKTKGGGDLSYSFKLKGTDDVKDFALNSKLDAKTYTLIATAAAKDNYELTEEESGDFVVNQAERTIEWNIRDVTLVVGQTFGESHKTATLSAGDGVPQYTPKIKSATKVGEKQFTVTVTVPSVGNYKAAKNTFHLYVRPKPRTVKWINKPQSPIVYGTKLDLKPEQVKISAGPKNVFFDPPGGKLEVGEWPIKAFVKAEGEYGPAEDFATVKVDPAEQVITWPPPAAIVYGVRLGENQLNAKVAAQDKDADDPEYKPKAKELLPVAGSPHRLTVTFAKTKNYNEKIKDDVYITVNPATPEIKWDVPDAILAGTALPSASFKPGKGEPAAVFTYTPSSAIAPTAPGTPTVGSNKPVRVDTTATPNFTAGSCAKTIHVLALACPANIAAGHAYDKHVLGIGDPTKGASQDWGNPPTLASPAAFEAEIQRIMQNPTHVKKAGANAYFWDDTTGTIVIYNPSGADNGTCYRPKRGKAKYDEQ